MIYILERTPRTTACSPILSIDTILFMRWLNRMYLVCVIYMPRSSDVQKFALRHDVKELVTTDGEVRNIGCTVQGTYLPRAQTSIVCLIIHFCIV